MIALRPQVDPEGFFRRLANAPSRVLVLDYDGTLAPFKVDRDRAIPYPGVREAIRRVTDAGTRVVLVSGRTISDLQPLIALDTPVEMWGTHGWERLHRDGQWEGIAPAPDVADALAKGRQLAVERTADRRVETKTASVATHVRGLPDREAAAVLDSIRAAWRPLEGDGLALREFDGGLELRALGRDKGTALNEVLKDEPSDAAIAYLGDDLTDEDAFRSLHGRGLSVLVRGELRDTAADVWIRPPEELLEFFYAWRGHCIARASAEQAR